MNTDISKSLYPSRMYFFQSASCIHRQSPYYTCYLVAMVALCQRKLDAKYSKQDAQLGIESVGNTEQDSNDDRSK